MRSASHSPIPTAEAAPAHAAEEATTRVRWLRALVVGLMVLPVTAWWSADAPGDIIFSLLVPPMAGLMALALVNWPLRRWLPRWSFTRGELVLFYVFLSVATVMCAEWLWVNQPYVATYALFADREPWTKEHIVPHLPAWFYLQDASALEDYRRGGYTLTYALMRLGVWAKPIAAWTALFGLLTGAMLCINALMREQWTRREKLAFPVIQVPVLLTQPRSPAWRSSYLWGAFGVVFAIDMLNGSAFLYPSLPSLNTRFILAHITDAVPWMGDRPWGALGWTPVGLFPYMAAIGFFMPTDLLFSLVFFFFARKALQVGIDMYGYEQGVFGGGWLVPSPPYFSEQTWGAVMALFLSTLIASRGYLREVAVHVRRNTAFAAGDTRPRVALVGLVLTVGGLSAIGHAVGLAAWVVAGYACLFLVFSVVLTRIRAQIGSPIHEFAFFGPHQLLLDAAGSQVLSEAATVKLYHLFFITNRIHRTDPMPYQLEGFKLGEGSGVSSRGLLAVMAFALVAGVAVGQAAYIGRGYIHGAAPAMGEPANAVRTIFEQQRPANVTAIAAVVAGFAVVIVLDLIRFQYPAFPLHPLGYALSMNFGVDYCWFGLLLALVVKGAVQRYFGLKGYEKLRLAAIGVILAEFGAEAIWATVAMATDAATYTVSFYNGRAGWMK